MVSSGLEEMLFQYGDYQIPRGQFLTSGFLLMTSLLLLWLRTRGEVTAGWREQYNEELHNLRATPDIITMMRWVRYVALMREKGKHSKF
jgi:head-tail adaptor